MLCHILSPTTILMSLSQYGSSLADTQFAGFAEVIPETVKFSQTKKALAARRIPVKIRAEQTSYSSTNNNRMRILMPNSALYDTRYGYVTFNAIAAATGGTYVRFAQGIHSIINRTRILAAATEVEDLRDCNRIQTIVMQSTVPTLTLTNVGTMAAIPGTNGAMGFGTQLQRNAVAAGADYCLPLFSHFLNTELMPFKFINAGITLELYIEDPTTCVETDGTAPTITISNLEFHVERLELQRDYEEFIAGYISTYGLELGFHTWERFVNTLPGGTQQQLTINSRSSSINGMLNIFVDSSQINTTTVNDKFLNWARQNLIQYNTLLNGSIFPDEPIDAVTNGAWEVFQIYCRWAKRWMLNAQMDVAPALEFQFFTADSFLFILDLEAYPEYDNLINPFTSLNNNSNISLRLQFSAPTAANLECDTWVESFRRVCIYRDGKVSV